ncbi:Isochorismate synthase/isochorismate lyase [Actinomadura rubteroloni]|uniref:Isochorismate synthase/isochorismate lyase n=1 Tax=Actinomadura rubteroloni TaxID=1926885 RepID=A0A2P4UEX3_9ACTN|nr:salicylate synthase [Actinomadura rubteroloni]POM23610.1 Isochorismate synthase/isochorismate lyase [Actinomadura rubteroloni]
MTVPPVERPERTERVVATGASPVLLMAALAGSNLFDEYVVYEKPGMWTFAGGALGEVILEADTVSTAWPDAPRDVRPWSGRPADALRAAFAACPLPTWNAYGWIAFEFAARRPAGRLAHLLVPRVEVRVHDGTAHITGGDRDEVERVTAALAKGAPEPAAPTRVQIRTDGDHYRERVAEAIAEIHAGRYQKVILSRTVDVPFPVDVIATYVRGRRANTPARSFLSVLGDHQALGFSPEVLALVTAGGRVRTDPLAGTRAFNRTDDDPRLRNELLHDPKEVFEHAISVYTAQDELQRICAPGTVRIGDFMTVKQRGSVQHLGSTVTGTLARDRTSWDALDTLFPGVTASGVPKAQAIEAITRLDEPRGLYSGAALSVTHEGALDCALVLRALYRQDGRTWLRAGAGIVGASNPEREFEETCEKLTSIAPHVVASEDGTPT